MHTLPPTTTTHNHAQALSEQLKREFADTSYGESWQTWYGMFYSVYSFPNIILPIFGGFFVDKFGVLNMLVSESKCRH